MCFFGWGRGDFKSSFSGYSHTEFRGVTLKKIQRSITKQVILNGWELFPVSVSIEQL